MCFVCDFGFVCLPFVAHVYAVVTAGGLFAFGLDLLCGWVCLGCALFCICGGCFYIVLT